MRKPRQEGCPKVCRNLGGRDPVFGGTGTGACRPFPLLSALLLFSLFHEVTGARAGQIMGPRLLSWLVQGPGLEASLSVLTYVFLLFHGASMILVTLGFQGLFTESVLEQTDPGAPWHWVLGYKAYEHPNSP